MPGPLLIKATLGNLRATFLQLLIELFRGRYRGGVCNFTYVLFRSAPVQARERCRSINSNSSPWGTFRTGPQGTPVNGGRDPNSCRSLAQLGLRCNFTYFVIALSEIQGAPKERRRGRAAKRLSKRVFLESPFLLCPLKAFS